MTNFLLIRHAATDAVGRELSGRRPGVRLSDVGRRQASELAERLSNGRLDAIHASPLERAVETAEPLAARLGLELQTSDAFQELDFGEWTGRTFAELDGQPEWRAFNTYRSGTRIPGGEHILEVQARAVAGLERLAGIHPDGRVAIVSHADVLRAVLAHFLGMPIDLLLRLEIGPASVSVLRLDPWGPRLLRLNDLGPLLPAD